MQTETCDLRREDRKPDIEGLLRGRRLLLVSNREPYVRRHGEHGKESFQRTAGGLVTALDPVMRRCRGVWIAWDPGGEPAGGDKRIEVPGEDPRFTLHQVPLTTGQVRRYYYGFANRALWPLCHYFVDRCHFDAGEWRQYVKVNQRFAEAVRAEGREHDLVWIHDYHFCLLPRMVREHREDDGPIVFFLHIPFPAEEVFRILPWRRELLEGMLGADLIGFHVGAYAGHFLGCCARILGAEVDHRAGIVRWQGRETKVRPFPIGIDVESFLAIARERETRARARAIRHGLKTEKVILGVDRLDYSKGIPARLFAIDQFLSTHRDLRGRFTFVQVAVPSRTRVKEYRELKREIDELVGRLNGRYGTSEWQPIHYVYSSLPRQELVAHYLAADVALITPLRDGMNLVAKEFCACREDDDAVLVLSEFTGAAEPLAQGALLVNPFSIADVVRALHRSLTMPRDERRRRMSSLRRAVHRTDVHRWLADILTQAGTARGEALPQRSRELARTAGPTDRTG